MSTDSLDFSSEVQSGDEEQKTTTASYAQAALGVPYRMQQVLVSWVFNVASVALILDFVALQDLVRDRSGGLSRFAMLCNWFGVVSCVSWLLGFLLLAHWLRSVGATPKGLFGCYMKVAASVFFNLQPMTGTMNDPSLGGSAGLWWSNLTGILFFHIGNLVSCLDFYLHMPPGAHRTRGWLHHGNLPITGMWTYQAATWLLVGSNVLSCSFNGMFSWAPLLPIASWPVLACQLAGGLLLLAGSVVYTVWCDGFRNLSHPPLAS